MIRIFIKQAISAILLLVVFFGVSHCHFNQKKLKTNKNERASITEVQNNNNWESLFDGKTLNGWRGIGSETVPNGRWMVEGGAIRNVGSGEVESIADGQPAEGGDIMTTETFENFELSLEWKILKAGNTGIKYNVSEEMSLQVKPKYSALGFEFQLLDDRAEKYEGLDSTHLSGALYGMIVPQNSILKSVGEYNTARIKVDGNLVEHWLNGVKVVAYQFGSEKLDSLYTQSKYKDYKGFLDKKIGHIVLQNHKDDAWFRNIKIKKL